MGFSLWGSGSGVGGLGFCKLEFGTGLRMKYAGMQMVRALGYSELLGNIRPFLRDVNAAFRRQSLTAPESDRNKMLLTA